MQTQHRVQTHQRRLPTPEFAVNHEKLCAVITRYLELRAFGNSKTIRGQMSGTLQERLARAQAKLLESKPRKLEILDGLCAEYVELKKDPDADAARLRRLESEIQNVDTTLRITDMGPGAFVAIVYLYYRVGMDSVAVASELGLNSPAVRQLLFRMSKIWKKMQAVTPS